MILSWFMVLCGLGFSPAHAAPHAAPQINLIGSWQYDGFFFEKNRYPNPNPDLELTFTFSEDGTNRLYWSRKNEPGFCERRATYAVIKNHLLQKVIWVNPLNHSTCAADQEMQPNRDTDTLISIVGEELWFHLELDGKPFIYILKKVPSAGIVAAPKSYDFPSI